MYIHLVGIGGTAASYLVDLAQAAGNHISGSDAAASQNTEALVRKGIAVSIPHNKAVITNNIDEVWYSSAITPSSSGFVELEQAKLIGIPTFTFAQAAARFFNQAQRRVAIAGTHGKSTTTAMVGWILEKNGYDPTVAIGATLRAWGGNGRIGKGDVFVIEADEYARRFLEFEPTHSIITSLEHDHFDTYPTIDELIQAFRHFVLNTENLLVANGNSTHITQLLKDFDGKKIVYGEHEALGIDLWLTKKTNSNYIMPLHILLELKIPGAHNRLNALAAIALCSQLGVSYAQGAKALADFPGIARRFEFVGERNGTLIYDDYGHHPTEIQATITAAREKFPRRSLILVYEPHQAGRLKHQMNETVESLGHADKVVLLPVFTVHGRENESDITTATSNALVKLANAKQLTVQLADDYKDAMLKVTDIIDSESIVITMGATDVWKVGEMLKDGKSAKHEADHST